MNVRHHGRNTAAASTKPIAERFVTAGQRQQYDRRESQRMEPNKTRITLLCQVTRAAMVWV